MGGLSDVTKSNLLKIVSSAAPVLGTALGSPIGGVLVSLVANAFGVSSGKVEDITSAVLADPDHAVKLRELELSHKDALTKIASENYSTEVSDRINARANAYQYKDFLRHMAYLVTAGFFGSLILIMCPLPMSVQGHDLLSMLVGMLVSKWQTIIDFFYGSSRHRQGGLK